MANRYVTLRYRLFNNISMEPFAGCWLWLGRVNDRGYGQLVVQENHKLKKWLTHRLSWTLERGPIPDGLCVLHRCDVPSCVNPAHLFLGTRKDNMMDCAAKGRFARQRKAHHVQ